MKEVFSEVLLHVSVFLVFIITLYFTFAVWIQQRAMTRDINSILQQIVSDLNLPSLNLSGLPSVTIPADPSTESKNRNILIALGVITPLLFIGMVTGAYFLAPHCFWHNAMNATSMLPFMLVTELIIIGGFLYTYVLVDATTLTSVLQNYLATPYTCNYMYPVLSKVLPDSLLSLLGINKPTGVSVNPSQPAVNPSQPASRPSSLSQ
jgi:hypothetical protein